MNISNDDYNKYIAICSGKIYIEKKTLISTVTIIVCVTVIVTWQPLKKKKIIKK